jgi:L-alanine-DL-glutamate epimerase-like enolase superfamily enzyme
MAGAATLSSPAQMLAQAVSVKPADLPDLTIKEVRVYNLSRSGTPTTAQANRPGTQIAGIVTNSGIEGNYTLAPRYWHPDWSTAGWLEFARSTCIGKSALMLPLLTSQWVPEKRRRGQSVYASAIDNCLWDILGKAVNLPVYKLLGAIVIA